MTATTGNYYLEQSVISIFLAAILIYFTELFRFPVRNFLFRKLDELRMDFKNNLCGLVMILLCTAFVGLWIYCLR
jgi:hypothetical protein